MNTAYRHLRHILKTNPKAIDTYFSILSYDRAAARRYLKVLVKPAPRSGHKSNRKP